MARSRTDIDLTRMAGITCPLWLAQAHVRRRQLRRQLLAATALLVLGLTLVFLALMLWHLPELAVA